MTLITHSFGIRPVGGPLCLRSSNAESQESFAAPPTTRKDGRLHSFGDYRVTFADAE
jgi:hypothetical protein